MTGSSRHWKRTLALVCLAVAPLVAACSATSSPAAQTTNGAKILRIGTDIDLAEADSVQVRNTTDRQIVGSTVYEPLFTSDPKGNPSPALAKSATASDNNTVWTLQLQSGVKFQDGKPFTAADVQANFAQIFNPKNASDLAGNFTNIKSVTPMGNLTVKFTLKAPDNFFTASITDLPLMGDMAARAKMGEKAWEQHPIGTGPYEWSSRTVGDNITFKRFDGYWRGKPPLAGVEFKIITDPTVATLALENGDLDMMTNDEVAVQALPGLEKSSKFQVLHVPSNTLFQAFMDFGKPRVETYKNVTDFHRGLAYLFNAQSIVPKVIGAYGSYADQLFPPFQAGNDPSIKPFPYDVKMGTQLLTEAGYPPGSTLNFAVADDVDLCQTATAIQSQIKQDGYKVNLQCSEAADEGQGPKYNWDVLFSKDSGRPDAAAFFVDRWDKSLATAANDKFTFESDHLQSIINEIPQQSTLAKSAALARQASDYIIVNQVAEIPLYWADAYVIASNKVKGLKLSPLGWQSLLMNSYTTVTLSS
jgi:peptide/nickel transport system substrate-binding protein